MLVSRVDSKLRRSYKLRPLLIGLAHVWVRKVIVLGRRTDARALNIALLRDVGLLSHLQLSFFVGHGAVLMGVQRGTRGRVVRVQTRVSILTSARVRPLKTGRQCPFRYLPGSLSERRDPMGAVGWDEQCGFCLALDLLRPSVAGYRGPDRAIDSQHHPPKPGIQGAIGRCTTLQSHLDTTVSKPRCCLSKCQLDRSGSIQNAHLD